MEIRFFGTSNGFISPTRWQTGILVKDEINILLDCGAPVAHIMAEEGLEADLIDLVWLSHSHSDHIGQFPSLIQHLWLEKRTKPLTVMGPALLLQRLREWLSICMLFPELLPFRIEWIEISPSQTEPLSAKGFAFTAFPTPHLYDFKERFGAGVQGVCFETLAVHVRTPSRSFGFSADLATPEDLAGLLGQPMEFLICEMTHFTPESLFRKLAGNPTPKLILTHYPDRYLNGEEKMRALAAELGYRGEVILAGDGSRHPL